ncbi:MAG: hypothetical protein GYA46_14705 [candidate division Zixibacteria bacterium]|nr:hypothetical protein [candidate division Zixibacteria bacterium]
MKRWTYIIIVAIGTLWLTSTAGAIDKKKKDTPAPKSKPVTVDTGRKVNPAAGAQPGADQNTSDRKAEGQGGAERKESNQNATDQKTGRSKYDNFIDVNRNGIDDRADRQSTTKPKPEPKLEPKPVPKAEPKPEPKSEPKPESKPKVESSAAKSPKK